MAETIVNLPPSNGEPLDPGVVDIVELSTLVSQEVQVFPLPPSGGAPADSPDPDVLNIDDILPSDLIVETPLPATDLQVSHEVGYVGLQGPKGDPGDYVANTLGGMNDVDITTLEDGSVLVYNEDAAKWRATTLLEQQIIDSGHY